MLYSYWSDVKDVKLLLAWMLVQNLLSAKQAEPGRNALCSSAASDPGLRGCFSGQETRIWHEASSRKEHSKTSLSCNAAHFSPRQSKGKAQKGNEAKAAGRTALILQPASGSCLLFPGIVLHPEVEAGHPNYLLLPLQTCEKESRDGRRKAAMLTGFAFKNI